MVFLYNTQLIIIMHDETFWEVIKKINKIYNLFPYFFKLLIKLLLKKKLEI